MRYRFWGLLDSCLAAVEKPFDQLNIYNESDSIAIGVSQTVWQTLENSLALGITGEWRHSKAFLLAQPFSFSRGAINGVSNVSVLRFSQDWLNRTDTHVYAARSIFNWGLDALNATINPGSSKLPDGRYFFWLGQAQWVQRLFDTGIEMHLQGNAQGGQSLSNMRWAACIVSAAIVKTNWFETTVFPLR